MTLQNVTFQAGGKSIDDRGAVSFINDFKLADYVRFYVVENHQPLFIRAWHGHRHESKAVVLLSGAAIVAAVKIDNWDSPSPNLSVERFVLTAEKPGALIIPPGYANGFMTLTEDAKLCFFSSSTVEESIADDFRYPAETWNPWEIVPR